MWASWRQDLLSLSLMNSQPLEESQAHREWPVNLQHRWMAKQLSMIFPCCQYYLNRWKHVVVGMILKERIWFLELEISEFYHTWAIYSLCEENYFTLTLHFSILILKWLPKLQITHSTCEQKGQTGSKTKNPRTNYNKIATSCLPKPQRQMGEKPQPPRSHQCLCGWKEVPRCVVDTEIGQL